MKGLVYRFESSMEIARSWAIQQMLCNLGWGWGLNEHDRALREALEEVC